MRRGDASSDESRVVSSAYVYMWGPRDEMWRNSEWLQDTDASSYSGTIWQTAQPQRAAQH
jgi:hypothetical protein